MRSGRPCLWDIDSAEDDSAGVVEFALEMEKRELHGDHCIAVSPRMYEVPAYDLDKQGRPRPKRRLK